MIGVLLINLGTPAAPTALAVRAYLAEFLSDKRVVELPSWLWLPVLHTLVLPIRAIGTAARYRKIWTTEGSPLLVNSQKLAVRLQAYLGVDYQVVLAMRYGQPSLQQGLALLQGQDLERLVIVPLYPQYAAATVATSFDVVTGILKGWRYIPPLQFISGYSTNRHYIAAIARCIRRYWHRNSYLLFSFHSLPQRSMQLGDPYWQQCHASMRLLAEELALSPSDYQVMFQSRFGYSDWLKPYCDTVLSMLPKQGKKRVSVVCPGFAVDCLESLEEIAQHCRRLFLAAGGEAFSYIPALNETEDQLALLKALVM